MAGANINAINDAFKTFKNEIDETVFQELDKWCQSILKNAIAFRFNEPEGHNFTGNLINSIVVILYRKSTGTSTKYFAYDKIKFPIRRELSGLNARKRQRKNRIWFSPDWSGENSAIRGSGLIPTDESWGQNDAITFANNWLPSTTNCDFVICVAYTSEYASFVEHERNTTGILQTESFVGHSAIEWIGLKQVA